jgi:hypothetical protein
MQVFEYIKEDEGTNIIEISALPGYVPTMYVRNRLGYSVSIATPDETLRKMADAIYAYLDRGVKK